MVRVKFYLGKYVLNVGIERVGGFAFDWGKIVTGLKEGG